MTPFSPSYRFFELLKGIGRSSQSSIDIGSSSGSGEFISLDCRSFTIALDCDFSNLKKNKQIKNKIAANVYKLPFRNTGFDLIILKYVLEHLEYPELAVRAVADITKKNQFVYAVVPKYYAFQDSLYRLLGCLSEILKCGKQAHISKFSFGSLCRLFYDNGFVMVDFYEAPAGLSFLDKNKGRSAFKIIIRFFLKIFQALFKKNLLEKNEMHFIFCKFD